MDQQKYRVAVIMSSFNGERYIEEQIESILHQTGVEVSLFIRDDGSADRTPYILSKYSSKGHVDVTYGRNIGIGNSFMKRLYSVPGDYDYYAFSDQDDIWEENKLSAAVCRLKEETGCALYASDLECVDADDNRIGMRFEGEKPFDCSLLSLICRNYCYGCTQVFNKNLFLLLLRSKPSKQLLKARMHDSWVAVSAAAAGRIIFERDSHIRYRRHGGNYTNFDRGETALWKVRFSKLIHRERRNPSSKMAKEVLRHYAACVENNADRDLICSLTQPRTIKNRFSLIRCRKRFAEYSDISKSWFAFKVIAGVI